MMHDAQCMMHDARPMTHDGTLFVEVNQAIWLGRGQKKQKRTERTNERSEP